MLLLVLPFQMAVWEWRSVLLHGAFQRMAGALLIELMFWSLDKVPFTCSYFPGRTSLSILAALYLYGFTSYSFHKWRILRARSNATPCTCSCSSRPPWCC